MGILSFVPSWDTIKGIGGSKTVSVAGLFPFVGYLLVANENVIGWITLVVDGEPASEAARQLTLLRMREIYFALVWLSAGVILLKLFCPREVSLFTSGYEYHRSELMIAEPLRLKDFQRNLDAPKWVRWFWPSSLKEAVDGASAVKLDDVIIKDGLFPDLGEAVKSREDWMSASGREISLCLNATYQAANYNWPLVRIAATIAFAVGYLKLSYPAYKVLVALLAN
jgi:hypothetical protein